MKHMMSITQVANALKGTPIASGRLAFAAVLIGGATPQGDIVLGGMPSVGC